MADEEFYRKAKNSIKDIMEGQKQIQAIITAILDKANRSEILLDALEKALTTVNAEQQQAKDQLSKTFDFYREGKDSLLELSLAQREAKECVANITYLQNSISLEMQKMKLCLSGFPPSSPLIEEFQLLETTLFVVDVIQNSIGQDIRDFMTSMKKDLKDMKAEVSDTHLFVKHDLPNQLMESFADRMLAFVYSSEQLVKVRDDASVQIVMQTQKSLMNEDSIRTDVSNRSDEESVILSLPKSVEEKLEQSGTNVSGNRQGGNQTGAQLGESSVTVKTSQPAGSADGVQQTQCGVTVQNFKRGPRKDVNRTKGHASSGTR